MTTYGTVPVTQLWDASKPLRGARWPLSPPLALASTAPVGHRPDAIMMGPLASPGQAPTFELRCTTCPGTYSSRVGGGTRWLALLLADTRYAGSGGAGLVKQERAAAAWMGGVALPQQSPSSSLIVISELGSRQRRLFFFFALRGLTKSLEESRIPIAISCIPSMPGPRKGKRIVHHCIRRHT